MDSPMGAQGELTPLPSHLPLSLPPPPLTLTLHSGSTGIYFFFFFFFPAISVYSAFLFFSLKNWSQNDGSLIINIIDFLKTVLSFSGKLFCNFVISSWLLFF
jgi:hypothetical protein